MTFEEWLRSGVESDFFQQLAEHPLAAAVFTQRIGDAVREQMLLAYDMGVAEGMRRSPQCH